METFFTRFKNPLVLIAILLAQTLLLATQIQRPAAGVRASNAGQADGRQVQLVRLWASELVTPFERLAGWTGSGIRATWQNYIDLRGVRSENTDLKQQIAKMRLERAERAEDALEAQRLRHLLDFKEHYVNTTVVAEVIGTSGSDASHVLTLNKGADDGLRPDMAVITPDGVVGKLRDVFGHTSQLLLLNDQTSGAGVVLEQTRIRAVVRGTPMGRVQITNLTQDSRVQKGAAVVTSGGDQVFPRGLPVGTIETIAPDPEHQPYVAITLKTAANLNQLEEVLVVTGVKSDLDPKTQQQLAADAEQHAAEGVASRLPSLKDASTPATDAAKPADAEKPVKPPPEHAKVGPPKPAPVAHPDKYSPGAAPKADELTPGAPRN